MAVSREHLPKQTKTPLTPLITFLQAAQSQAKITFLGSLPETIIDERFQNAIAQCRIIEKKIIAQLSQKLTQEELVILFQLKNNTEQLIAQKDFALLELEINKHKDITRPSDPYIERELNNLNRCKKIIKNIQALSEKIINELLQKR